jgi:hypothetical protein
MPSARHTNSIVNTSHNQIEFSEYAQHVMVFFDCEQATCKPSKNMAIRELITRPSVLEICWLG